MEQMKVNDRTYEIIRLLGHGKGGYSYLASDGTKEAVIKQIHHEPCSYYQFGDKIQAELTDYEKLRKTGIRIPQMLDVDQERERILKEYIQGPTIYELILQGQMSEKYVWQVRQMSEQARQAGLNIDYFPTNFVVHGKALDRQLYYIDYECNPYTKEWNFENWGIWYWSKTPEFMQYAREHKSS